MIETADVSALPAYWVWPQPEKLKAADGETDIYATVFLPPGLDPKKRYPVLDMSPSSRKYRVSPVGSFSNGSIFSDVAYYLGQAHAALGFVVVMIDGRGVAGREKSFLTHRFPDQAYVNDFSDRIAAMRQLAASRPYMDLERVGISADENGTHAAIYSLLLHADFYKVCVIQSMPDQRFQPSSTIEAADGVFHEGKLPRTPWPEDCVEHFSGKLLLIPGIGAGGIPAPSMRLADALYRANKDFDMISLPSVNQAVSGYGYRRSWDYFARHLLGEEPPHEFKLDIGISLRKKPRSFLKLMKYLMKDRGSEIKLEGYDDE